MKGLARYCLIIFALFILGCLAFMGIALVKLSVQGIVMAIAPIIYAVLTALCFRVTLSAVKRSYDKKCWAIFGLVWSIIVVLLPVLLAVSANSAVFPLFSAGQEWTFIAFSLLMALLFIPAIVFFAKYLVKSKTAVKPAQS